jgi:hypothetical protein
MTASAVPDGAACYFCLGEEEDDEGMPLVRDCSCRGDSAGYAHLSCLAQYAAQKCKAAGDRDFDAFSTPWVICNNCKQPFQGQLSLDLSSAFVFFAETTYGHTGNSKWDKMKVIDSLRSKIMILDNTVDKELVKVEMILFIKQMLSMIDQTKKDLNMSGWIHMPKYSEEYKYYIMLCGEYEAYAYSQSGAILTSDTSEESFKIMVTHYKKASAICNLVGMKDRSNHLDAVISVLTAEKQGANDTDALSSTEKKSVLGIIKNSYELNLHTKGMDSEDTIRSGLFYAKQLRVANHCIEAERLATKLATISRRVHGPEHNVTIESNDLLEKFKERLITVLPDRRVFQALRYKNDGEICVVTGPITEPRQVDEEREHSVQSNLILPEKGCAVICRGLVSASHLNGRLGEVRNVKQEETGATRLGVFFEKKGVKSALVKPENVRIVFELPSEE